MPGICSQCPRCHGHTFRSSRSRGGWLRRVAAVVRLFPVRCTHCDLRVWRFVSANLTRRRRVAAA